MNPDKTPVAQDVFTYCTREKIDTWHVVRNHNAAGVVDRVVCKSCGSEHKYRLSTAQTKLTVSGSRSIVKRTAQGSLINIGGSPTATSSKRSAAVTAKVADMEDQWFMAIKEWGDKPVLSYSPDSSYSKGEVLNHPHFGKGAVQNRRENKVDVLFKAGLKTLPSKLNS